MNNFKEKLDVLISENRITEDEYKDFLSRGIQYKRFGRKYPKLDEIFPDGIPVGASNNFIDRLDVPYQETSYVCASAGRKHPQTYLYKADRNGSVINLLGGKRPIGDSIFAALNRIILGNQAIIISADNLIANSEQIWDWHYFGQHLKNYRELYGEVKEFAEKCHTSNTIQVILARKRSTFERLDFLDKYKKNQIAIFNSKNPVVIITDDDGYEYIKDIRNDNVKFIVQVNDNGDIDIKQSLMKLRREFGIKIMLNDGGRKMSNGIKDLGLLGGERISYEPYPGRKFISDIITNDMVIGKNGIGRDNSQIRNSIVVFSKKKIDIDQDEFLKIHLYSMHNF